MYNDCNYTYNTNESELPVNKNTYDISFVSRQIQMMKINIRKLFEKDIIYSFESILKKNKKE